MPGKKTFLALIAAALVTFLGQRNVHADQSVAIKPPNTDGYVPDIELPAAEMVRFSDDHPADNGTEHSVEAPADTTINLAAPSTDEIKRLLQEILYCTLAIAWDGSSSVAGAYQQAQQFVAALLQQAEIGPGKTTAEVDIFANGLIPSGLLNDLTELENFVSTTKQPGGGTYGKYFFAYILQQILSGAIVPSAENPLVIPYITDGHDDDQEAVQALITEIIAASPANSVKILCLGISGGAERASGEYEAGLDLKFFDTLKSIGNSVIVRLYEEGIDEAIPDIPNIMQVAACGVPAPVVSTGAPSAAITGAPSVPITGAPPVPITGAPPVPYTPTFAPTTNTTNTTQAAPPIVAEVCGVLCTLPLLLLLFAPRRETVKTKKPSPMASVSTTRDRHKVTLEPATMGVGHGETTMGGAGVDGQPLWTTGINIPKYKRGATKKVLGAGESLPATAGSPGTQEYDVKYRYFVSEILLTAFNIGLHVYGAQGRAPEVEITKKVENAQQMVAAAATSAKESFAAFKNKTAPKPAAKEESSSKEPSTHTSGDVEAQFVEDPVRRRMMEVLRREIAQQGSPGSDWHPNPEDTRRV